MTTIIVIIIIGAALAFFAKLGAKANMEKKLGRSIEEHELVSLNSWMEAKPEATKNEAVKTALAKSPPKDKKILTPAEKVAALKENYEKEFEKLGNNCAACGAALSKNLPYCGFCGHHASRKALEMHCAIFLTDLEEEFKDRTPALHDALRLGCVWTILFGVGFTGIGVLLTNAQEGCVIMACAAAISALVGYLFTYIAEKTLDKKESALFQQWIAPKIKQFMQQNNLKPVEFLGIAKKHLNEGKTFEKYLFRQF